MVCRSLIFWGNKKCGRWDLNPHKRNAYKILSLARLPVPTLPHIAFLLEKSYFLAATDISITKGYMNVNTFFEKNLKFSSFF